METKTAEVAKPKKVYPKIICECGERISCKNIKVHRDSQKHMNKVQGLTLDKITIAQPELKIIDVEVKPDVERKVTASTEQKPADADDEWEKTIEKALAYIIQQRNEDHDEFRVMFQALNEKLEAIMTVLDMEEDDE